jgi:hypothetical protein
MYTNDQHEQAPTLNDTLGDTHVVTTGHTEAADWYAEMDAAFGYDERQEPTMEEEEQHYASYMAGHVGEMKDDELAAVMDDETTPAEIRHLCQLETIKRVAAASDALPRGDALLGVLLAQVQSMLAVVRAANVRAIRESDWTDGEYTRTSELRSALAGLLGRIGVNARKSA